MMHKFFLGVGMAALLGASTAGASTLVSVVATNDIIYPIFTGSIADGATGTAATLTFMTAGFYITADIGLTDASGTTLFDVITGGNDSYTLYAAGSGDPQIGTSCAAYASACVVVPLHVPTSLQPTIGSLNGRGGICCGHGDLVVAFGGTIPEPASWTLLIVGFAMTGTALRARARVTRAS